MSINVRSGRTWAARANAVEPSAASPTTCISAWSSRRSRTALRTRWILSATRIRIGARSVLSTREESLSAPDDVDEVLLKHRHCRGFRRTAHRPDWAYGGQKMTEQEAGHPAGSRRDNCPAA